MNFNKYRIIEGFQIKNEWIWSDPTFPEPPDEPEYGTEENTNQWNQYRDALNKFTKKYDEK